MLQILGWLLCLCLFVKGVELASLPEGHGNDGMRFGAGVAMLGALGFAIWIYSQGNAISDVTSHSPIAMSADPHADDCLDIIGTTENEAVTCGTGQPERQ